MESENKHDLRTRQCALYLTEEDYATLREYPKRMGFPSLAKMLSAIVERLIIGGFSGASFVAVGWQLAKHREKYGLKPDPKKPIQERFWFGSPPIPLFDKDTSISPDDPETMIAILQAEIDKLKQELKTK